MELPPENRRAKAKVKDMVERFEKQFSSDGLDIPSPPSAMSKPSNDGINLSPKHNRRLNKQRQPTDDTPEVDNSMNSTPPQKMADKRPSTAASRSASAGHKIKRKPVPFGSRIPVPIRNVTAPISIQSDLRSKIPKTRQKVDGRTYGEPRSEPPELASAIGTDQQQQNTGEARHDHHGRSEADSSVNRDMPLDQDTALQGQNDIAPQIQPQVDKTFQGNIGSQRRKMPSGQDKQFEFRFTYARDDYDPRDLALFLHEMDVQESENAAAEPQSLPLQEQQDEPAANNGLIRKKSLTRRAADAFRSKSSQASRDISDQSSRPGTSQTSRQASDHSSAKESQKLQKASYSGKHMDKIRKILPGASFEDNEYGGERGHNRERPQTPSKQRSDGTNRTPSKQRSDGINQTPSKTKAFAEFGKETFRRARRKLSIGSKDDRKFYGADDDAPPMPAMPDNAGNLGIGKQVKGARESLLEYEARKDLDLFPSNYPKTSIPISSPVASSFGAAVGTESDQEKKPPMTKVTGDDEKHKSEEDSFKAKTSNPELPDSAIPRPVFFKEEENRFSINPALMLGKNNQKMEETAANPWPKRMSSLRPGLNGREGKHTSKFSDGMRLGTADLPEIVVAKEQKSLPFKGSDYDTELAKGTGSMISYEPSVSKPSGRLLPQQPLEKHSPSGISDAAAWLASLPTGSSSPRPSSRTDEVEKFGSAPRTPTQQSRNFTPDTALAALLEEKAEIESVFATLYPGGVGQLSRPEIVNGKIEMIWIGPGTDPRISSEEPEPALPKPIKPLFDRKLLRIDSEMDMNEAYASSTADITTKPVSAAPKPPNPLANRRLLQIALDGNRKGASSARPSVPDKTGTLATSEESDKEQASIEKSATFEPNAGDLSLLSERDGGSAGTVEARLTSHHVQDDEEAIETQKVSAPNMQRSLRSLPTAGSIYSKADDAPPRLQTPLSQQMGGGMVFTGPMPKLLDRLSPKSRFQTNRAALSRRVKESSTNNLSGIAKPGGMGPKIPRHPGAVDIDPKAWIAPLTKANLQSVLKSYSQQRRMRDQADQSQEAIEAREIIRSLQENIPAREAENLESALAELSVAESTLPAKKIDVDDDTGKAPEENGRYDQASLEPFRPSGRHRIQAQAIAFREMQVELHDAEAQARAQFEAAKKAIEDRAAQRQHEEELRLMMEESKKLKRQASRKVEEGPVENADKQGTPKKELPKIPRKEVEKRQLVEKQSSQGMEHPNVQSAWHQNVYSARHPREPGASAQLAAVRHKIGVEAELPAGTLYSEQDELLAKERARVAEQKAERAQRAYRAQAKETSVIEEAAKFDVPSNAPKKASAAEDALANKSNLGEVANSVDGRAKSFGKSIGKRMMGALKEGTRKLGLRPLTAEELAAQEAAEIAAHRAATLAILETPRPPRYDIDTQSREFRRMAARDQKEKKKKAAWRQKIKEKQEAAERAANR